MVSLKITAKGKPVEYLVSLLPTFEPLVYTKGLLARMAAKWSRNEGVSGLDGYRWLLILSLTTWGRKTQAGRARK